MADQGKECKTNKPLGQGLDRPTVKASTGKNRAHEALKQNRNKAPPGGDGEPESWFTY